MSTEQRDVTKDDIFLKARLISEGVRIQVNKSPTPQGDTSILGDWNNTSPASDSDPADVLLKKYYQGTCVDDLGTGEVKDKDGSMARLGSCMILEGSGLAAPILPKPRSSIDLIVDGDDFIIEERGKVLGTALNSPAIKKEWKDLKLSNGMPMEVALPGMSDGIINLLINWSCNNVNAGRGCQYCNLFVSPVSRQINRTPISTLNDIATLQSEAVKILTDKGWRGTIAFTGGALPVDQRREYLQRMDAVLSPLQRAVGDKVYSELGIVYNHYPPENFNEMNEWKEFGISATSMDLEVADPAYFPAICPGKNAYKPHEYWRAAQEASVDVFGPFKTSTNYVMGMEPINSLVEGVDERVGKGVFAVPLIFQPLPGAPMEGFSTPSAEWITEATDKVVDTYLKHAPTLMKVMMPKPGDESDATAAMNPMSEMEGKRQEMSVTTAFDELARRLQGMQGMFGAK